MDDTTSDPGDNGIYVISDWRIVEHFGGSLDHGNEDEEFDLIRMLEAIDARQPEGQQLGPDGLRAPLVARSALHIGDKIIARDLSNEFRRTTVYFEQHFPDNPDHVVIAADLYRNDYGAPARSGINLLLDEAYRVIE